MNIYKHVGPFEIKKPLGEGGTGRVFLAENVDRHREVAVKLIAAKSDAVAAERWGARLTQQLNHPGAVRVYDFGEVDDHFFIEMEYVSGATLNKVLQQSGALPADRASRLAIQTCEVLSAAHAFRGTVEGKALTGIIHGDLSWSNLLVQPDDRIKIIDFGIADALTATRTWKTVKGQTPNFAAPEQLKPGEMRVESDIWAIGVLLYVMLTKQLPFNRTAEQSTEERILWGRPTCPENVPTEIVAIVSRALQKSHEDRYPSVQEMQDDLTAFLQGKPLSYQTVMQPSAFATPSPDERTVREATPHETWAGRPDETAGRWAVVVDASESAWAHREAISQLARDLLNTLPHVTGRPPSVYFLGNATPYPASDWDHQIGQWYQANARRTSLMAPILERIADDPHVTVIVLGAGRLFDIADWQGTPVMSRTLFVRFGTAALTDWPDRELEPSLASLQAGLHRAVGQRGSKNTMI